MENKTQKNKKDISAYNEIQKEAIRRLQELNDGYYYYDYEEEKEE